MKTMLRRIARATEAVDLLVPVRDLVTRDDIAWVVEVGCDAHATEDELGKLEKQAWMARFTVAELDKIVEAAGGAEQFGPNAVARRNS
ncbi:MAG: hypothetical protein JST54_28985 [Deltaproteobacteria bacterium]|nr:hypothetical protein [Deltaproteobacteria bacterium]